jgi:uncharacterized protein (TIGR02217 family)
MAFENPTMGTAQTAQAGLATVDLNALSKPVGTTTSEQLSGILNQNGALMQQAATMGNQQSNARGLLNSSMGIQAAQGAVLSAATPIAQADAATYGAAAGFRFKNWLDYEAVDEVIGTATGAVQSLQLVKNYVFGSASNAVMIRKPVAGTVQLKANGVAIRSTTNTTTGIVTFTAPAGHEITWSGEFDIPVSFESDEFAAMIETYGISTIQVQLVEDLSA